MWSCPGSDSIEALKSLCLFRPDIIDSPQNSELYLFIPSGIDSKLKIPGWSLVIILVEMEVTVLSPFQTDRPLINDTL
jgi:hypothetical protein